MSRLLLGGHLPGVRGPRGHLLHTVTFLVYIIIIIIICGIGHMGALSQDCKAPFPKISQDSGKIRYSCPLCLGYLKGSGGVQLLSNTEIDCLSPFSSPQSSSRSLNL